MVQYKLTYFNTRGLAETSRLIFHYAGVPFDDVRITRDEWAKLKSSTPFGQVPLLEVDGAKIAQASAIARFLAREFELEGKDKLEVAQVDAYNEFLTDIASSTAPYLRIILGFTQGDKEKPHKDFLDAIEQKFPILEKIISSSGSGFLAKSGVTWVDFKLATSFQTLLEKASEDVAKFSVLKEHSKKVHDLPQLRDYLSKREKIESNK